MESNQQQKGNVPPGSRDIDSWRQAVAKNLHIGYPAADLFAALQDLGPDVDVQLRNAIAQVLSRQTMTTLRRRVGANHPNQGWDIILRVHEDVFTAVAKPSSSDGKGFRNAYSTYLSYRLKDAIGKEWRERRTEDDILSEKARGFQKKVLNDKQVLISEPAMAEEIGDEEDLAEIEVEKTLTFLGGKFSENDDEAPTKTSYDPELFSGVNQLIEQLDVDRFLETHIPNEKKRLAFRLFMDDVPFKTKRKKTTCSIADALGIDESTAREWIKETQEILKAKVGRAQ